MDCSTPGFPIPHHLLELAQMHVHWVTEAIQPSHPVIPFSSCPQSFPASGFIPSELALHIQWPKFQSFSFRTVLPMNTQGWISQETTWPIISQRLGADTRICLLLSQILVRFPQQWKQYKTMPEKNSIFKLCFKNLIIFIKEMWLMVTGNEVTIFND